MAFGGGGGGAVGAGGPYDVSIPPGEQTGPTLPANPAGGLPLALLLAMLGQQGDLRSVGGPASMSPERPLFGPRGSNPISGALTGFFERRMPGYSGRVRDAYNAADASARTQDIRGGYAARAFGPTNPNLTAAFMQDPSISNPLSPNYDWNAAQGAQFAANVASGHGDPSAGRGATAERGSLINELINIMLEQGQNPAMGTGQ